LLRRRSTDERIISFIEGLEKLLLKLVVLGVLLLIVVQIFMTGDSFRYYLSGTERMEGRPIPVGVEAAATADKVHPMTTITFKLRDFAAAPKVDLKVNGRAVAKFKNGEVTVAVDDGDLIELDGGFYTHQLVFAVKATSGPVSYPKIGQEFVVQHGVTAVGRVKIEGAAAVP